MDNKPSTDPARSRIGMAIGNGENAAWTEVTVTIPAELLREGRNEIAVSNLSPSGNFNAPPYVLLADAVLNAPGARATALAPDNSRSERDRDQADEADEDDENDEDDEDDYEEFPPTPRPSDFAAYPVPRLRLRPRLLEPSIASQPFPG